MIKDSATMKKLIKPHEVVAIIPARGGSKGVPGKNIRDLEGYPLIAYSIVASILSEKIDRVIVSTDSEEIADIARKYGAEVPFMRPAQYASDTSGDIEFVEHFINRMSELEGSLPEYIVHIRPTTPLRDVEIVDEAIEACMSDKECCSLRSAHLASESPFKWFVKNEDGYFGSMSGNISNEDLNGGRQAFSDVYIPDGYVDVLKTEFILDNGILHGDKMLAFESPMCYEVDTLDDLELIRYMIRKSGSALYDYLKQNYERNDRS